MIIENETILLPTDTDGISAYDGKHWIIRDCLIDLSDCPLDTLDEALGITYGCSAEVTNTTIRGAGKLILCGSGDVQAIPLETGKTVTFKNCILENGGRRFPEVQDGMRVILEDCTIRNWGMQSRFDTRAFGAWAHDGGAITAIRCHFEQDGFWQTGFWNFFKDIANHLGQAVNDRGIFGLTWRDFIPGVCRGLTASDGGTVTAIDCTKNKWWIRIEGVY